MYDVDAHARHRHAASYFRQEVPPIEGPDVPTPAVPSTVQVHQKIVERCQRKRAHAGKRVTEVVVVRPQRILVLGGQFTKQDRQRVCFGRLATAHIKNGLEALLDQEVSHNDVSPSLCNLVARVHIRRYGRHCIFLPFLLQRRV